MEIKSVSPLKYASGLDIEVKAGGDGRISGHGSVFNNVDLGGEKVIAGAFTKSLTRNPLPKMLWQHDQQRPIGKWQTVREDGRGLYVEGQINLKTTAGRDAYEHLVAGDVDGMSIGYHVLKDRYDGNVRVLEELALHEVSVVTFAMNPAATVSAVKHVTSKTELFDLLREAGLAKAAATRVAAAGWPALSGADHHNPKATDLARIIDAATAQIRSL